MSNTEAHYDQLEFAQAKADEGVPRNKVKAMLVLEYDLSDKACNVILQEVFGKGKKDNFIDAYYDWLAVDVRSTEEVEAYVKGDAGYPATSANVKKHLSHYKRIAELANRIHESK